MNARLLLGSALLSLLVGFAAGYLQPTGTNTDAADGTRSLSGNLDAKGSGTGEDSHLDFEQAFTKAMAHPSRLHREHDLAEIFGRLSSGDFPQAANALLRLPVEVRSEMLKSLYAFWAAKDPAAACQHTLSQAKHMLDVDVQVVKLWMEADPAGLAAWLRQRSDHERQLMAESVYQAALALKNGDPGEFMPLVLETCAYRWYNTELIPQFFRKWSAQDLHKASAEALAIRNGRLRSRAIEAVAESWAERDPHGALLWVSNVSDPQMRQKVETSILSVWAGTNPTAAAEYAQTMPDAKTRNAALAKIAISMLKEDPLAASSFADSIPLADFPEGGFYKQWAKTDPSAASEAYVRRITELEPAKRKQLEERMNQVFYEWTEKEPKAAAEFALAQPEGVQEALIDQAAWSWTDKDRTAAVEWGVNLPEGSARKAALQSIAARWACYSTNEVATWLQSLPSGGSRDAAVAGFATTAIRTDSEGALMWLRTIPDPQKSADALAEAWRTWVELGGIAEATRWLKSVQGLTPLERASVEKVDRSMWVE